MSEQRPEERKHLFGTTEKSDFILNMSQQQTYKLCGLYSIIAIAVLFIVNIPYTIAKHTFDRIDEDNIRHYADDLFADYISILVIGVGLIGFWFFLVGRMKKEVVIGKNKQLGIIVLILAVSAWSMFASGSISTCFLGYLDRSEGLLTILAYWGFFAAGMTLTGDKWRVRFTDVLISIGLVNAIVGIFQSIPEFYDVVPNKFKDLFVRFGATATEGELAFKEGIFEKGYAASGLMVTPFALAALMTIVFGLAASGFAFEKSGKKKVFYGVSALACTAAAVLTKTVVGMIGVGAAALALIAVAIVSTTKNKQKKPFVLSLCAAAAACACVVTLVLSGAAEFKDEQIINTDQFYRLSIGMPRENKDDKWIYPYLWNDGAYVIQQHPITGTGPDNWGEIYENGCDIDRSYNEYIDIAMQRGVLCLVLYVAFLLVTLKKMFSAAAQHFKDTQSISWVAAGLCAAMIGYLVQAFFNSGSNYSSPYFFLIAGVGWSYFAAGKIVTKKKEKTKK